MRRCGRPSSLALVVATSICLLSACGDRADVAASLSPQKPAPQASKAALRNATLLAAAEPFEALTEQASTAQVAELARLRKDARTPADAAGALLQASAAAQLQDRSAELDAALAKGDRVAVAVASVESYRVLVSAQDAATAKAPIAVSLLDYAGFKYSAHLSARPTQWDEMARDVAFAKTTWSGLSGQVSSAGLRGAFQAALSGMDAGVTQKNAGLAQQAAETELALVDLLEEQLARR